MAAETTDDDSQVTVRVEEQRQRAMGNGKDSAKQEAEEVEDDDNDDDDEDEEPEEEPKLKYTRLTSSLGPIYRNGDATSTFMVAGDKMVWRMSPSLQAPRATMCRVTC